MRIRDAIGMIEKDGWRLVAQKGSHRQFKHPVKPGRVTIAGALSDELAPGTPNGILKQARLRGKLTMEYLVVIEKAGKGFSAYIPDVPGCVATGATPEKARARLAVALEMHLAGLAEDGLPEPPPEARADYISVSQ